MRELGAIRAAQPRRAAAGRSVGPLLSLNDHHVRASRGGGAELMAAVRGLIRSDGAGHIPSTNLPALASLWAVNILAQVLLTV